MNKTEQLIELLKESHLSNFQMQQAIKCSAADRIARKLRTNPPQGYYMQVFSVPAENEYPAHKIYKLEAV